MTSSIQGIVVDPTPPNSGEGLIFNGTAYVPTPANPGDITAVNTNPPLTGGGTSGALTLNINNFTGDSGAGGLDGAVPAPAAGDAAAGKVLGAGGGWVVPAGGGATFLDSVSLSAPETIAAPGGASATLTMPITLTKANLSVESHGAIRLAASAGVPIMTGDCTVKVRVDGTVVGGRFLQQQYDGVIQGSVFAFSINAPKITGLALGAHTVDVFVEVNADNVQIFELADAPVTLSAEEFA